MLAKRVDSDDFEIVRANPQVLLTTAKGSVVVGTLQLLTKKDVFEDPLGSLAISGAGWSGAIKDPPSGGGLIGTIRPFVWIKPKRVNDAIKQNALQLVRNAAGGFDIILPPDLKTLWKVTGKAKEHAYSLRPTSMLIRNCSEAEFDVNVTGANPGRETEGSLAIYPGEEGLKKFGVIVDVDMDTHKGFAVPLDLLVTDEVLRSAGLA